MKMKRANATESHIAVFSFVFFGILLGLLFFRINFFCFLVKRY